MHQETVTVGMRLGRWTVVAPAPNSVHRAWDCRCACGAVKAVRESKLLTAKSQVCRCANNPGRSKHGASESVEYAVWRTMKSRVLNPNNHKYARYGGRGIKVCERWLTFENFIADMGPRPSKEHTLERVDNDGDYCPENCAWILRARQARNRRDTRHLTIDGVTRPFAEWCEMYGVSQDTVEARIYRRGWDALEALTMPLCRSKYHRWQMKAAA